MIRVPEVPAFALGLLMLASTSRIASAQEASIKYHRNYDLSEIKIEKNIFHVHVSTTCDDGDGIGEARLTIMGGGLDLMLQAESSDHKVKGTELILPSGINYQVSLMEERKDKAGRTMEIPRGEWSLRNNCYSAVDMEDAIRTGALKGGFTEAEAEGFVEQRRDARRLLLNPPLIEPEQILENLLDPDF